MMTQEAPPADTSNHQIEMSLSNLSKDVQLLSQKVEEMKNEMKNTYATKSEITLIREWVKPYVERQRQIELLVIGAIVAAFLKIVLIK